MTDRAHPEAGSTHIIRYALELGLLWIDGDGRNKVREALDALAALEAQLEAIGAAPAGWRELAAKVMDALADAQDTTNSQYPEHVRCYPSWERHARWLRWHADMFRSGNPVGNGAGNPDVLAALAASPTPPADQQAPKAAPVVWLSSKQLRGVTALHGQYLPFRCQPEGRFDTPVYLVEAAPKAAPASNESAYQRGYMDGMAKGRRDAEAAPQQEAQEPVAWEGAEEWEKLAWHLCAEENGEDACNDLIWEGGPMPEPWGDRWLKYEGEARRMIALVRTHVTAHQPAPAPLSDDAKDAARYRWLRSYNTAKHPEVTEAFFLGDQNMDAAIDAAIAAQGGKA